MYITPLGHLTLHTFANNITWHGIKDFEVYGFSLALRVSLSFKADSCYLLNNLWLMELGFLCAWFIENFLHRDIIRHPSLRSLQKHQVFTTFSMTRIQMRMLWIKVFVLIFIVARVRFLIGVYEFEDAWVILWLLGIHGTRYGLWIQNIITLLDISYLSCKLSLAQIRRVKIRGSLRMQDNLDLKSIQVVPLWKFGKYSIIRMFLKARCKI